MYVCRCLLAREWLSDVLWCSDINECENEDMCMYGTCINKPGGYECRCEDQYELIPSGTGCVGL